MTDREKQVEAIHELSRLGWSRRRIAAGVGCSPATVSRVLSGEAPEPRQPERSPAEKLAARYSRKVAKRRKQTLPYATRHCREWTSRELEIAARDDLTVKEIALQLGRTYVAVSDMRHKIRANPGPARAMEKPVMDRETRDLIIRELAALGWQQKDIAAKAGCGAATVSRLLHVRHTTCLHCGGPIPESRHGNAVMCSKECYQRHGYTLPSLKRAGAKWRKANASWLAVSDKRKQAAWRAETLDHAANHGKEWTGPELKMAARHDLTAVEIALQLGRTYKAVTTMRHKLRTDPRKTRLAGTAEPAQQEVA